MRREELFNKEKLIFGLSAAMLVWASVGMVASDPRYGALGPFVVADDGPPRRAAADMSQDHISWYLIGARANPFVLKDEFHAQGVNVPRPEVVQVPLPPTGVRRPGTGTQPTQQPEPVKVGDTPKNPRSTKPAPGEGPTTAQGPKPYELPVTFVGVFTDGDTNYALLRDKDNDAYVKLIEGQAYPDLGIKVVKVTKTSVVLENSEGKPFLLRDLLRQIQSERLKEREGVGVGGAGGSGTL